MATRNSTPKQPIRIEGAVAYVPLTQGYEAVIDALDVPLADAWGTWHAVVVRHTVYARRTELVGTQRCMVYLHRVLRNAPADQYVDHINGDGLDNRRENLRLASNQQNLFNQRISRNNSSGFKGVTWEKDKSVWRAQIYMGRSRRHLGSYPTPELAHAAYAAASARLHGEFGRAE